MGCIAATAACDRPDDQLEKAPLTATHQALSAEEVAYRCVGTTRAALTIARRTKHESLDYYADLQRWWYQHTVDTVIRQSGRDPAIASWDERRAVSAGLYNGLGPHHVAYQVEIKGDLANATPGTRMAQDLQFCIDLAPPEIGR